jgi:hypothetical protein
MYTIKNGYTHKVVGQVDDLKTARELIRDTDNYIQFSDEALQLMQADLSDNKEEFGHE